MTDKQVIETELECVKRQQCDRDCAKCDLVMDSGRIVRAYEHAIMLLEMEEQDYEAALAKDTNAPVKCDTCPQGAHWDGAVICGKDGQRHERDGGCDYDS